MGIETGFSEFIDCLILQSFNFFTHNELPFIDFLDFNVVVLGKFVDVIDRFDDVALYELLILLPHTYQIALYFTKDSLELAIKLSYLAVYIRMLSL
jgi:hypothetical protein